MSVYHPVVDRNYLGSEENDYSEVSGTGDTTIRTAPASTASIVVTGITITPQNAGSPGFRGAFQDGDSNDLIFFNAGANDPPRPWSGRIVVPAGKALQLSTEAITSGSVHISVQSHLETA